MIHVEALNLATYFFKENKNSKYNLLSETEYMLNVQVDSVYYYQRICHIKIYSIWLSLRWNDFVIYVIKR